MSFLLVKLALIGIELLLPLIGVQDLTYSAFIKVHTRFWYSLNQTLYSRINGDLYGGHVLVSLFVVCCIDCRAEY